MRTSGRRAATAFALALGLLTMSMSMASPARAGVDAGDAGWTVAWARSQHIDVLQAVELGTGGRGPLPLIDQTVRVIARVTGPGSDVRITLSNRYGATPLPRGTVTRLRIPAASVARRSAGAGIVRDSLRTITFDGSRSVSIPVGGSVTSDPVALTVDAGEDLAVSLHVRVALVPPAHASSQVTSYVALPISGDHTRDLGGAAFPSTTTSSPILSSIDVRSASIPGAIAATGGSVVDGVGSGLDAHDDLPAQLAERIHRELPVGVRRTVVNSGIGGTTAAMACSIPGFGPSVQERVEADSLALARVSHLILYAGTNDLAGGCNADQIIAAFRDIVAKSAAQGVKVIISTITPRGNYTEAQNLERSKVNAWVRRGGNCSGRCHRSVDFDAAVRDGGNPNRIDPRLDSGDGVHPNGAGYARIARSIPLDAFA